MGRILLHIENTINTKEKDLLTSKYDLALGQIVKSLTGRDKDNYYLIIGFDNNKLVLADGRKRPVNFPKKKNIRHVQKCNLFAADQTVFRQGNSLTDEQVRAYLKASRLLSK